MQKGNHKNKKCINEENIFFRKVLVWRTIFFERGNKKLIIKMCTFFHFYTIILCRNLISADILTMRCKCSLKKAKKKVVFPRIRSQYLSVSIKSSYKATVFLSYVSRNFLGPFFMRRSVGKYKKIENLLYLKIPRKCFFFFS